MHEIANLPLWVVIALWILVRTNKLKKFVAADPVVMIGMSIFTISIVEHNVRCDEWWRRLLLHSIVQYKDELIANRVRLETIGASVIGFIPREGGE